MFFKVLDIRTPTVSGGKATEVIDRGSKKYFILYVFSPQILPDFDTYI